MDSEVDCERMTEFVGLARYFDLEEFIMSKRARKRRSRKGKGANHGKRPNT